MTGTAMKTEATKATIDSEVLRSPEMGLNMRLLRAFGLWAIPTGSVWRRAVYRTYSTVAYTIHGMVVLSVFIQLWLYRSDLAQLSDNMSVTLAHTANCVKILPLFFFREGVRSPLSSLRALWESGAARGAEERLAQAATVRRVRRISVLYLCLFLFTYTVWELTALGRSVAAAKAYAWRAASEGVADAVATTTEEPEAGGDATPRVPMRFLPLRAWYPFNLTDSYNFILAFTHQSIGFFYTVSSVCSSNLFYFALIIHASSQFHILRESLLLVRTRAVAELCKAGIMEEHQDPDALAPEQAGALDTAMQSYLADCIRHHQQALKLTDEVRILMEPIMFTECVTMSIQLCMLIFQATTVPLLSPLFLSELSFLLCEMTQLFLYCYFGSELILQSQMVQEAAYQSNWQSARSSTYRKSIAIIMARTLHQSNIKALSFSTVSLELFTGLLKASYSYYTLMRQVHDEEPMSHIG